MTVGLSLLAILLLAALLVVLAALVVLAVRHAKTRKWIAALLLLAAPAVLIALIAVAFVVRTSRPVSYRTDLGGMNTYPPQAAAAQPWSLAVDESFVASVYPSEPAAAAAAVCQLAARWSGVNGAEDEIPLAEKSGGGRYSDH